MSHPIKPNQSSLNLPNSTGQITEFDADDLLNKCGEVLKREIEILLRESNKQIKLNAASSRDLVNYTKLLNDIREAQKDELKNMPTEELEKIAKKS